MADIAVEEFTAADEKALRALQGVQKANYGRMKGARTSIERTDEKIVALQDRKWAAAPAPRYIEEDDYLGFQALMGIHGSDVAHRYRHDYILSMDRHFRYEEWDPKTLMPVIRIEIPHDEADGALVEMGEAMVVWSTFLAKHAGEVTNKIPDGEAIAVHEEDRAVLVECTDFDMARYGAHWLRVFPDATAQRVERRGSAILNLDSERRPLFDVLADVREHWYFPASSNPEHTEASIHFGWADEAVQPS